MYYLGGIAIFVLILACINFINLATANSNLRKKEIGIRKVVGASRLSLFRQFTGEFILYSSLAMLLAFILAKLLLPYFNTVVQRQLSLNFTEDVNFILFIIAAFLITGFLTGIYPFNLLIAIVLALPAGYIISVTTPGAYKYHLQFWDFFLAIGLMFITALAATLYHTTKAVIANPVDALRYE